MWPKALAQLLELLPHIARLLPAADRFLLARVASDETAHHTLEETTEGLRSDLRRVSASYEGLYRQLNEQTALIAQMTEEAKAARAAAEAADERAAGLERRLSFSNAMLTILLPLIIVLVILTVLLVFRH
jgi:chromosome segregation ATPase